MSYATAEGFYSVTINGLGLFITAGTDDEGQPYVSVNTENMAPEHRYDEATGLPGTARPYTVGEAGQGDSYEVIAAGAAWSTSAIHCPRCGADAEPTNRGRMPKWRCSDQTCTFRRGWRLRPSAGRVFAVPVGDDFDADPIEDPKLRIHAVPWLDVRVSDDIPEER